MQKQPDAKPTRLAASVEVTPRQIEKDPAVLELIPPATRTYLVDLGTMQDGEWAAVTKSLTRAGLEPVPHLAARRLKSAAALESRLSAMVSEAGIRDVLLIAGGAGAPEGPFGSTMDVLETGLLDRYGIRRMAVAGHPEGSPDISDAAIEAAIKWKSEFAERTDADMRITTQFSFDAHAAIRWAEALKRGGVTLPIHIGVAGPASIKSLLKYSAMCGVRASSAFAFKRGAQIASLLTSYSPEPFVGPIEQHVADTADANVQQLHVFPFGGIAETRRWLVERGTWEASARAGLDALHPKQATEAPVSSTDVLSSANGGGGAA
ncbi:MAG: methylenetetrahydrofolate reductase [Pseudomonadota bacterium]